jgi:hypothetical protein
MRFSIEYDPRGIGITDDPFEYDWTFISDHETVYWFWFYEPSTLARSFCVSS